MARTKNTVFNMSSGLISMLATSILGFVSRTLFIRFLDVSYLGINGLYSNILSMLSLAELGIGTSIAYSLYKPLADKNYRKINALMTFYRKAYTCIGLFIAIVGMVLMFFLETLIPDISSVEHYRLYYVLFLFNTVSSYFLAYKETLISADQKGYKLTVYNLIFQLSATIIQILILALTRQYTWYLIVQIVVATVRKIVINRYITKQYPEVNFYSKEKVEASDFDALKRNVAGSLMNKIGAYVVYGTDNILIAAFANVATVGLYSNYSMVINIIYNCVNVVFSSMLASVGNLAAEKNLKKEYDLFKTTLFITFCLAGFTSICLFSLLNPFITIWIGEEFMMPKSIVLVVVLNYYLTVVRRGSEVYYSGNGLFWYGRYKSFVEALINLVASIVLAKTYGIIGIFIGTAISSICTSVFYDSYTLYKHGFKKSGKEFLKEYVVRYLGYGVFIVGVYGCTTAIGRLIGYRSFLQLFVQALLIGVLFVGMVFLVFGVFLKTEEFADVLGRVKNIYETKVKKYVHKF